MDRRIFVGHALSVLGSASLIPNVIWAEDDAKTKKIFESLDQLTSLELSDTSLKDTARLISQLYNISVQVDKEALAKIGLDENSKLTCKVSGKRLKQILVEVLPTAHEKLTYEVRDGVLWFTVKK